MDILKNLRELIIVISMAAMLTGNKVDTNMSVFSLQNIDAAEYWQENAVVNAAEKDLKCSAVKISLYEKTKYKLNGTEFKTKKFLGLVKNQELKKCWDKITGEGDEEKTEFKVENIEQAAKVEEIKQKPEWLNIYDCKGNIVAIVNAKKIVRAKIYNASLLRGKFEGGKELSYSEYHYDEKGILTREINTIAGSVDTELKREETAEATHICGPLKNGKKKK